MKLSATQFGAISLLGFFLLLIGGCAPKDKATEVTVAVDFGPAKQKELKKTVAVPERSTVFDALRSAFPVVTSGR